MPSQIPNTQQEVYWITMLVPVAGHKIFPSTPRKSNKIVRQFSIFGQGRNNHSNREGPLIALIRSLIFRPLDGPSTIMTQVMFISAQHFLEMDEHVMMIRTKWQAYDRIEIVVPSLQLLQHSSYDLF